MVLYGEGTVQVHGWLGCGPVLFVLNGGELHERQKGVYKRKEN